MAHPATTNIQIERVEKSRIHEVKWDALVFGRTFTDHFLIAECVNGTWQSPRILPYQNLSLSPAISSLHYGQTIFEGMKAYRLKDGSVAIFRIEDHFERMNYGARKLGMAEVPREIFVDGMKELIALDADWVPSTEGTSLYIRPLLFATDQYIGMASSKSYIFLIFACPVPKYYSGELHTKVITDRIRACRGGVGDVKLAGNYAPTLKVSEQIKKEGFHVALWLDALEFKYINEFSTMNFFCRIGERVITPPLDGTILDGITRRSVIQILKDEGWKVEERPISMEEVEDTYRKGMLLEAFGTGTAAAVAPVARIHYRGHDLWLPEPEKREVIPLLSKRLHEIRYGIVPDPYNWLTRIEKRYE
jgi:branched-chain amino acid aminotransferase